MRPAGRIPKGRFPDVPGVVFEGSVAEEVDFSRQSFELFGADDATFVRCDFRRVRFESGYLGARRMCHFVECTFDEMKPGPLIWGSARFERCSFQGIRMSEWWLGASEFVDCQFSGRVKSLQLWATPQPPWDQPDHLSPFRTTNVFEGNDLTRVDLSFPEFSGGVRVFANSWPSGPDYLLLDRWQLRLTRAIEHVARWTDADARERALWWIRLHRQDGRERQDEILIRTSDWRLSPEDMWDRLWALLAEPLASA